jgi:hypothetical protein
VEGPRKRSRRLACACAARRNARRRQGQDLSVLLQRRAASDRRGRQRAGRRLREHRRPVARAGETRRGRPADEAMITHAFVSKCRPLPGLSPGVDLQAPGPSPGSLDALRVGRTGRIPSAPAHERILAHLKSSTKTVRRQTRALGRPFLAHGASVVVRFASTDVCLSIERVDALRGFSGDQRTYSDGALVKTTPQVRRAKFERHIAVAPERSISSVGVDLKT